MRILVIGGTGMLGHKLVQRLSLSHEVFVTIRSEIADVEKFGIFHAERTFSGIDILDLNSIESVIDKVNPNAVINAVGIIKQLPDSNDVISALSVNSIFPHRLALLAESRGFRLICISTDCVFDGTGGMYTEDDLPNAVDLYGQSKRWGEVIAENCLTIRTSIIGRELETKHGLVEWFLGNEGGTVNGYRNAIYTGFPTAELASILELILEEYPNLNGLYHVSGEPINKFDLLGLVRDAYGANIEVVPFEDFRIDRSLDATKFRNETGFVPRPWPEMISEMAKDETRYKEWNDQQN